MPKQYFNGPPHTPWKTRSPAQGNVSPAKKAWLFGVVSALGTGCTADQTLAYDSYDLSPVAEINEIMPTVVDVSWTTESAGYSFVEYGIEGSLSQATPVNNTALVDHDMALLGLKAGETYNFRAVTTTENGEELSSAIETIELDPVPSELPRVTVSNYDESVSQEGGYMLYSLVMAADTWTVIIDRDGDYVWYVQGEQDTLIPTSKVGLDGQSILFTSNDSAQTDDISSITRIAIDGSSGSLTEITTGHHDFAELDNGGFAFLGMDFQFHMVDGTDWEIAGDTIIQVAEGANRDGESTEIFNAFEAYDQPWAPCAHFEGGAYGYEDMADWTHANSIVFDNNEDVLYVMAKNLDTIWKIDRQTGDMIWQLGGKHSDFAWPDGMLPWSHAHMSQIWNGGLTIFDNGFHHEEQVSRIVEYQYNEQTMTLEEVFAYSDPDGAFSPLFGDVKKLPEGNYMTSWMASGRLSEITPEGAVVWQADMEVGNATSRVTWIEDLYDM